MEQLDAAGVHVRLQQALAIGDIDSARQVLGDPEDFPNCVDPYIRLPVLAHALVVADTPTVARLLDIGADPNYAVGDGMPSLISVILGARPNRLALVAILIAAGADTAQRGVNDWTPLHAAASLDDVAMVELLLAVGADPHAVTHLDDWASPLEEAEHLGKRRAAAALKRLT